MTDYDYFDHDADIGIIGRGATIEQAFTAAARAMFAIMLTLTCVTPTQRVRISFEEADPELALVTWLNLLLAQARAHGLAFAQFDLQRAQHHWHGEAAGEPWHAGLERGVEVKGATLTMLSVRSGPQGWEARCVVDV